MDKTQFALEVEFTHRNANQLPAADFIFHADCREKRYSVSHSDKTFDGLQRGKFHIHMKRGLVLPECFDDFVPIRGRHDVGDEGFGSELANTDFGQGGESMSRRNDKYQFIEVDDGRA